MSEIEIIKLVFGIFLSLGGAVLLLLSFKLGYKYIIQEKRCTSSIMGTVSRTTFTDRGSGVFLPLVSYQVDGQDYKVVGPEFRQIQTVTKSSLWSENDTSCVIDEENQILKIRRTENSILSIRENPILELYPIGSSVKVYYDPDNPKLAFVERYCNKKYMFWLMFISALVCFAIMLSILILL